MGKRYRSNRYREKGRIVIRSPGSRQAIREAQQAARPLIKKSRQARKEARNSKPKVKSFGVCPSAVCAYKFKMSAEWWKSTVKPRCPNCDQILQLEWVEQGATPVKASPAFVTPAVEMT